ncbi:YajQ family cyclic di-GMP-binding protein [Candidatus Gracilibacteria bacterium]|nr:YajQ family cyclic di-GMP-binding protein [Candidatus Gracilibacteria bacterium]
MADDHSMDVVVNFDMQEMKNAVDQCKREALNRYDLKNSNLEIELTDTEFKVNAENEFQIEAVHDILSRKMAGRNLSPKILDRQKIEEAGGMRVRQVMKLLKVLDQETSKIITKLLKENFPKAKSSIQGETVRISSKSIDDLQAIMSFLKMRPEMKIPLQFTNYRG